MIRLCNFSKIGIQKKKTFFYFNKNYLNSKTVIITNWLFYNLGLLRRVWLQTLKSETRYFQIFCNWTKLLKNRFSQKRVQSAILESWMYKNVWNLEVNGYYTIYRKKKKKKLFSKTRCFLFSTVTGTGLKLDVSQIKKKKVIFFYKKPLW